MDIILEYSGFLLTVGLIVIGYLVGGHLERKHYQSIRAREKAMRRLLVISSRHPPSRGYDQRLVMGSVVVRLPVPELGPKTTGPKLLVPSGWVLECHTGSAVERGGRTGRSAWRERRLHRQGVARRGPRRLGQRRDLGVGFGCRVGTGGQQGQGGNQDAIGAHRVSRHRLGPALSGVFGRNDGEYLGCAVAMRNRSQAPAAAALGTRPTRSDNSNAPISSAEAR